MNTSQMYNELYTIPYYQSSDPLLMFAVGLIAICVFLGLCFLCTPLSQLVYDTYILHAYKRAHDHNRVVGICPKTKFEYTFGDCMLCVFFQGYSCCYFDYEEVK
jgi:hypothetical protein